MRVSRERIFVQSSCFFCFQLTATRCRPLYYCQKGDSVWTVSYTHLDVYKRQVLTAAEITNWGLSFQEEGKPPVGNATAEYLQQYDSLYCVPTEEKVLYLTFDAGFENGNTCLLYTSRCV